jgi:hypothetical protein
MVITMQDARELRARQAETTAVVSLYLNVPVDIAEHHGLLIRARDLVKAAEIDQVTPMASDSDLRAVVTTVAARSQDWLGQGVAIFACAELGLVEVMKLPGRTADVAVIAARPYLRPLLATRQRNPAYQVAVIDTKHAWVLGISDGEISTLAERTGQQVPSKAFAGWYGLQAYRIQQRIMQLSRQHFRDTITMLLKGAAARPLPLVLCGQEAEIGQFCAMLPDSISQRVAGTIGVDSQVATPGRVRELAAPVIADWVAASEAQLVNDLMNEAPGKTVITGLGECATAVRARAVAQLVLADGLGPGPDVLDELAGQALDGGGEVLAVRDAPFTAAARLRFQVTAASP